VKVFSSSEKAMVQSRCLGVGGSSKQVHVDFDGKLLRRRDFFSKCARVQPGYCEISRISRLENVNILFLGKFLEQNRRRARLEIQRRRIQELSGENRSWKLNFSTVPAKQRVYLR